MLPTYCPKMSHKLFTINMVPIYAMEHWIAGTGRMISWYVELTVLTADKMRECLSVVFSNRAGADVWLVVIAGKVPLNLILA